MTAISAFLKTPLGRWLAGAVILLLAFLVFRAGVNHEKAAEAKRIKAAVKVVRKVEKGGEAITAKTEAKTAERVVEIRTVTKTLTKEVPVYVTAEADRRTDLPMGFVWLHDQAAAGVSEIPAHPGVLPDAPSGIELSAATQTIIANYGTAHEWREAALACRSWVSEQADLWNKSIKGATQ